MGKIKGSVNVAKIDYNLRNMKDCENQSNRQKIRNSKKAYKTCRVLRTIDIEAPRQKSETPRMLIKPIVFEGC